MHFWEEGMRRDLANFVLACAEEVHTDRLRTEPARLISSRVFTLSYSAAATMLRRSILMQEPLHPRRQVGTCLTSA